MTGNVAERWLAFIVLLSFQFMFPVSLTDTLNWGPDSVIVGPGPVMFVTPWGKDGRDCGDIPMDECLGKLQTFLRLTDLPFPSEREELDKLCNNLMDGYKCSAKAIPQCLTPVEERMMRVFVSMGEFTALMFCSNGDGKMGYLRDLLLENSDCIKKHKKSLECCAQQTKIPDLPIKRLLEEDAGNLEEMQRSECCPVSNYIRCVRASMLEGCGKWAANLTTRYIRRATGEEFERVCQKMPDYPELRAGVCERPVPVCSGASPLSLGLAGLIIILSIKILLKM